MNKNGKIEFQCPFPNKGELCQRSILTAIDLRQILTEKQIASLHQKSVERAVAQDKNMANCPTPDCKYAFLKYGTDFTCPMCNQSYCGNCMAKPHPGMSCNENAINNQDSTQLREQLKQQGFQECSKCKTMVVRSEGCNHMTCRCTHEFCYICGADWKPTRMCSHELFEGTDNQQNRAERE